MNVCELLEKEVDGRKRENIAKSSLVPPHEEEEVFAPFFFSMPCLSRARPATGNDFPAKSFATLTTHEKKEQERRRRSERDVHEYFFVTMVPLVNNRGSSHHHSDDDSQDQESSVSIERNAAAATLSASFSSSSSSSMMILPSIDGIEFVDYIDERQLEDVMRLVGQDLSEPYSGEIII